MHSFLLSKIEVDLHLYVNFSDSLHLHGETIFVSTLVVTTICLFLILGTRDLNKVPGNSQNVLEVIYDLVKA